MKIVVKDLSALNQMILKKGFTQNAFSKAANVPRSTTYQILTGRRNPGPNIAKKITEALEVEFDDIFFIENACKCDQEKRTA